MILFLFSFLQSINQELERLSKIAEQEPQLAYQAYIRGLSPSWLFIMRTVPDIKDELSPLEETLKNKFIHGLIGRLVSPL